MFDELFERVYRIDEDKSWVLVVVHTSEKILFDDIPESVDWDEVVVKPNIRDFDNFDRKITEVLGVSPVLQDDSYKDVFEKEEETREVVGIQFLRHSNFSYSSEKEVVSAKELLEKTFEEKISNIGIVYGDPHLRIQEEEWEEEEELEITPTTHTWGSIQYKGIEEMFDSLVEEEEKVGREELLRDFGWDRIGKPQSAEKARTAFIFWLRESDQEEDIVSKRALEKISKISKPSGDDMMEILKYVTDLWIASEVVVKCFWPNIGMPRVEISRFGESLPPLMASVHEDDETIAAYCWLLFSSGLVEDEESFKDFNT